MDDTIARVDPMDIIVKRFEELNVHELHDIYKLRVAVFVVEQNCPYQEIDDNVDENSIHVCFRDDGELIAYIRVVPAGVKFDDVSIGRVICTRRRQGIGSKIMAEGIRIAQEEFGAKRIVVEAQTYARKFYEASEFEKCSDEFLEDGIPHIMMALDL